MRLVLVFGFFEFELNRNNIILFDSFLKINIKWEVVVLKLKFDNISNKVNELI